MKKRALNSISSTSQKRSKSSIIDTLLLVESMLTEEENGLQKAFEILYNLINNSPQPILEIPLERFKDTMVARYTLAIVYLQHGRTDEADKILLSLGFKYRLSKECFQNTKHQSRKNNDKNKNDDNNFMHVVDNAIPLEYLAALENFFQPQSSFWSHHNYPNCDYFSYSYQNFEQPSNLIENIIFNYIYPTVKAFYPQTEAIHCEWWAHSRYVNGGSHQLHYDTDERGLKQLGKVQFPYVSTVLYFENFGSPTLITAKKIGVDPMLNSASGYLAFPSRNRLLMFEGDRLHGVVPNCIKGFESQRRLTLMVGFWGGDVCTTDFNSKMPSANMKLPKNIGQTNWLLQLCKLQDVIKKKGTTDKHHIVACKDGLTKIEKVWIDIKESVPYAIFNNLNEEAIVKNRFIGKYFINNLNDLDSDIAIVSFDSTWTEQQLLTKNTAFFPLYLSSLEFILRVVKDNEELIETAQDVILMLTKKSVVVTEIVSKSKMWHDFLLLSLLNKETTDNKIIASAIIWNIFEYNAVKLQTDKTNVKFYKCFRLKFLNALVHNFKKEDANVQHYKDVKEMCAGALAYTKDLIEHDELLQREILNTLKSSLRHYLYLTSEEQSAMNDDTSIIDLENAIKVFEKI